VLRGIFAPRAFVVSLLISDDPHSEEDNPVMPGEKEETVRERFRRGQPTWRNPADSNGKRVWYTSAIGSEPRIADVKLERVREAQA
jgi:sirohydrochlorin cobaltochelatase